jgi:hypothetical protein
MALTATIYTTDCVWGSSSFNSTTDLKVGKTGSTSSDGTQYRGRVTFAAIPKNWVIQSITLRLNRIDSNSSHTLTLGGSTGTGFSASLAFSLSKSFGSGTGTKNTDLTAHAATIQSFGTTWYIHVRHGSGTNSYTEFSGDERSNSLKPALIITYVLATVWYRNGSTWVECEVYYRSGSEWVQCIPYYNSGGTWIQV